MTASRGIYAKRGSGPAFFRKNVVRDTDDCIIWPYHRSSGGYGKTTLSPGKQVLVHAAACELAHGPCPTERHLAAHSCGNRSCFNPKHLRWATYTENWDDARNAGWPNGKPGQPTTQEQRYK